MSYTEAEFAVVCPKCRAARGGKCLDKVVDRSHWIEEPHAERVEAAARITDESTKENTRRDL